MYDQQAGRSEGRRTWSAGASGHASSAEITKECTRSESSEICNNSDARIVRRRAPLNLQPSTKKSGLSKEAVRAGMLYGWAHG